MSALPKYRVIANIRTAYRGDDREAALAAFKDPIVRAIAARPRGSGWSLQLHYSERSQLGGPMIEALLSHHGDVRSIAMLYGVDWDEWVQETLGH